MATIRIFNSVHMERLVGARVSLSIDIAVPYAKSGWNSNTCPVGFAPVYDRAECDKACTYLSVQDGSVTQTYGWRTGHAGGCGEYSGNRCLMNSDSGGPSPGSNRLCKKIAAAQPTTTPMYVRVASDGGGGFQPCCTNGGTFLFLPSPPPALKIYNESLILPLPMLTRIRTIHGAVALLSRLVVMFRPPTTADSVQSPGNDGSCDCAVFCASNWGGTVLQQRPLWRGATSVARGSINCECVEATHWCKLWTRSHTKSDPGCSTLCDNTGIPTALAAAGKDEYILARGIKYQLGRKGANMCHPGRYSQMLGAAVSVTKEECQAANKALFAASQDTEMVRTFGCHVLLRSRTALLCGFI